MIKPAVAVAGDGPATTGPDRLHGFAHPSEVPVFFGNREAEQALLASLRTGRMAHGWLIVGPEGVGKATLAYRLARFALAINDPLKAVDADTLDISETSRTFRQVVGFSHPNLLVLRRPWQERTKRFATAITVGEVRRLRSFLGSTAGAGPWRVVIVDRAEEMNVSAANALLKSLEEPPPRTLFLLVSAMPGRLPVTIRSRCRMLALTGLAETDLRAAIGDALGRAEIPSPDEASLARAIQLANGSVRRTLELLALGGSELYDRLLAILTELPVLDMNAVHTLADELTGRDAEARFELAFALLSDALARIIRHSATGTGALGAEAPLAAGAARHGSLAKWAELWETMHRAKADALALNLDRKNLILDVFFRLAETARP